MDFARARSIPVAPDGTGDEIPHRFDIPIASSYDLHRAVQGWSLDFRQLEVGTMRGRLVQVVDGGLIVAEARLDRRVEQRGETPDGMFTIGALSPGTWSIWHGREVDDESLLVFDGLDAVSPAAFSAQTVSVAPTRLVEAERLSGIPLPDEELLTGSKSHKGCDCKILTYSKSQRFFI